MRQWVRPSYTGCVSCWSRQARELSTADVRVVLRGKALEFYSRHYGHVFTSDSEPLSINHALLGINQLLDEDMSSPENRPPSIVQPVAYQFLRVFAGKVAMRTDDVGKSLRGTGIAKKEFERVVGRRKRARSSTACQFPSVSRPRGFALAGK